MGPVLHRDPNKAVCKQAELEMIAEMKLEGFTDSDIPRFKLVKKKVKSEQTSANGVHSKIETRCFESQTKPTIAVHSRH